MYISYYAPGLHLCFTLGFSFTHSSGDNHVFECVTLGRPHIPPECDERCSVMFRFGNTLTVLVLYRKDLILKEWTLSRSNYGSYRIHVSMHMSTNFIIFNLWVFFMNDRQLGRLRISTRTFFKKGFGMKLDSA